MDTARYLHGNRLIGELMETVISIWPSSKLCKEAQGSPEATKRGPGLPGWGNLKSGAIKYGLESSGTQNRDGLRWRSPATTVNYRPVLSSERAPHIKKPEIVRQVTKIWSWARHRYGLSD
jgi:hypothetical protein